MTPTDTGEIDYYTTPGRDREIAHAILAQSRHRNDPIDDIQVQHLLRIGYTAGRATAREAIEGARADVAGAVANLMRATDPADPAYDGVRRAYGVALEAAGLVPEETP